MNITDENSLVLNRRYIKTIHPFNIKLLRKNGAAGSRPLLLQFRKSYQWLFGNQKYFWAGVQLSRLYRLPQRSIVCQTAGTFLPGGKKQRIRAVFVNLNLKKALSLSAAQSMIRWFAPIHTAALRRPYLFQGYPTHVLFL